MDIAGSLVAIVDDDAAVRRALRRVLRSLDCSVIDFSTGEEFIASLGRAAPRCVLMDVHMSAMNGLDVLRFMRRRDVDVPVVLITGYDQSGLREKCLEAGAAADLVKPLARSDIAAAIEMALGG